MRRLVPWIPVALYAAVIFWLSSESHPLPFLPPAVFDFDKLLHAGEYAVLGALLFRALALSAATRPRRAALCALAIASLYGASDEWHQSYVPNRSADPWDWAADTLGAVAGATAMGLSLRRRDLRASIRA